MSKFMAISLKKAYRACLWLAEQKIGVNPEDRRGEWDLTKPEGKRDDFKWQRSELVAALPFEYFENSAYSHPYVPEIQSTSDDDVLYDGATFIDASNMIDGPLFSEGCESNFEDFSPNRNRPFFHPSYKMLSDIRKPEKINLVPRLSLQTCELSCENIPIVKENHKPALASVMAHCTLMELLKEGEIQASCRVAIVESAYDVTSPELDCGLVIDLPRIVFNKKTIPNYEVSATEFGLYRAKMMEIHFRDAPGDIDVEFISRCEFWCRDITVSDSFESWHMPQVRKTFTPPETATFKLIGNEYLIQYGSDREVMYKDIKSLSQLHKVMMHKEVQVLNVESGISPEEINCRIDDQHESESQNVPVDQYELDDQNGSDDQNGFEDQHEFDDQHGSEDQNESESQYYCEENVNDTLARRLGDNPKTMRSRIRKHQNLIYWKLCKFHELDVVKNKLDREKLKKTIINQAKEACKESNDSVNADVIKELLKFSEKKFKSSQKSIKELLDVKFDANENEIDSMRRNISNAIKSVSEKSPHLAYHLGKLGSENKRGVGYNSVGFYYINKTEIKWDFG
jgi:hypothetical protein